MNLSLLYVVCKDKEQAISIGKLLIEEKLAACINILDSMTSIYPWNGKIEIENEVVMIVKIDKTKYFEVESRILSLHSYEIPCIIQIPTLNTNKSYINWLKLNLKGE